ncbi:hypothetical protein TWF173_008633 [Orbilia oligospora]|nr:hypothetical protein TWF173_008633 [Orbilia oligospora]
MAKVPMANRLVCLCMAGSKHGGALESLAFQFGHQREKTGMRAPPIRTWSSDSSTAALIRDTANINPVIARDKVENNFSRSNLQLHPHIRICLCQLIAAIYFRLPWISCASC